MTLVPTPPEQPVEGDLLDPPDPHAVTRTEYPWGVAAVCACGRWEGVATGPSSARWVVDDYRRHVADEAAASADA